MAAASHRPSVRIAASPVAADIGLPAAPPESLPETSPLRTARWPGSFPRPLRPPHGCCAPAPMLPTERHSCRSGHTPHGTVVSCSAWHTHIACVGVLVPFLWGFWPLPACPRTYLHARVIKARPLPFSALSCMPSPVLRTSRTPSWLRAPTAIRPYTRSLCPTWLPGRVSPVPHRSVPTCRRLRPRGGPTLAPIWSAVCCLLRESVRVGSKVHKRTLANISSWPAPQVDLLRRVLKGEDLVAREQAFQILRSLPHGHVAAVLGSLRHLGLHDLLSRTHCPERDLICALVAARILDPRSKLATARGLDEDTASSSLAESLHLASAIRETSVVATRKSSAACLPMPKVVP